MVSASRAVGLLAIAVVATSARAQPASPPPAEPSTTVSGVTVVAPRLAQPTDRPRLELYEGRDFAGGGVIVVEATPNLLRRGFSDHARSARAIGGAWQLCNGPDYAPPCTVVDGDSPFLGDVQLSERVSSARPLGAPAAGR